MLKRISWGIAIALSAVGTISFGSAALAQTCANYPYTFANGTTADAAQVNANFAAILNCANTNLLPATNPIILGQLGFNGVPGQEVIAFQDTTWPAYTFDMKIGQYNGGTTIFQTLNTTAWELESGFTPAIFVNTSANVGIRTTSPSYTLHVNGSVAGTSAYNNLSDVRLKKNIVPIADALAIIGQLQGVRFDWRKPDERTVGKNLNLPVNDPQVGFIAQEVKKVLPQAVTVADTRDHLMSTQESKVVPVLVEAVKRLVGMNRTQAAEIEKLQHRVSDLERKSDRRTAGISNSNIH